MTFRESINKKGVHFCTGCGACVQKCNKGALSLKQDLQGYYNAHFEEDKCVNCNLCEKVCPVLFPQEYVPRVKEPSLYAVQMNDEIRSVSSSGGVFSALAEIILNEGGVVFGASWNSDLSVSHIAIDSIEDLDKLRRSKYVQSFIGDSYKQVKQFLKQNRKVLFTGTPCQIAGLNAFLGKDDPNLLTVDVFCLFAPSQGYFKKYLQESFGEGEVVSCNMRDKRHGWRCAVLSLSLSNGLTTCRWDYDDYWEKAFLGRLMMSEHCTNCIFPCHQRQGDLSIGDFWEICKIDSSFDENGTNALLVNSKKGQMYFERLKEVANRCSEKPLKGIKGNRIEYHEDIKPHNQSERFRQRFLKDGFLKSAEKCLTPRYDIAIVGCWEVRNYGSHLTYYALYKVLKSYGYDVVFIGCPGNAQYKSKGKPEYFKVIPYRDWEMQTQYPDKLSMRDANGLADTFIVGSDQLWEPSLYKLFGSFSYLDFIYSNKRKIAYATSFGRPYWNGSERERSEISYYLKRFSKISVREQSGVNICKNTFGVDAEWMLDPVFLCGIEDYNELVSHSSLNTSREYMAAYILDCTNEKAIVLQEIANKMKVQLQILTDPNIRHNLRSDLPLVKDYYVEDWIKWIRDSKYVITDSFHGMCLSIMYKKNFVAFKNERRGSARFDDYGEQLHIKDRILRIYSEVDKALKALMSIDYTGVDKIIDNNRKISIGWLKQAIICPLQSESLSDFDVISIRQENSTIDEKKYRLEKKISFRIRKKLRTFFRRIKKICKIIIKRCRKEM